METKPEYREPIIEVPPVQTRARVAEPASPAVIALIGEAEKSRKAGDLDSAVTTLERALRIQPRNADIVYRIAEIRLKQEKPRLSEDLAKKANLLAGGNYALKKRSWLLIAEARRRQGMQKEAMDAEKNARQYGP